MEKIKLEKLQFCDYCSKLCLERNLKISDIGLFICKNCLNKN